MNCRTRKTVITAAAIGVLSFGGASTAYACSKVPVSIQRFGESAVLFIGRAVPDTVQTGPGDVKYSVTEGHFGRAGDRIIHGQKVDVETLSSVDRKLLPAGTKQVVLVPWDYGADCSPTPWTRTARWIAPGTRGIYNAILRKESHWLKGVPVLDVYSPEFTPYTGIVNAGMRAANNEYNFLSVDELYAAIEHLPDAAALKVDPIATRETFLQWSRANRDITTRPPLSEIVRMEAYMVRTLRAEQLGKIFDGTFRFTISIGGEREREFYARTTAFSPQPWEFGPIAPTTQPEDITSIRPINGLEFYVTVAPTLTALPATCMSRNMDMETYLQIALNPETSATGEEAWSGKIDWGVVSLALGKDPVLAEFKSTWEKELTSRFGKDGLSERSRTFFGDADGVTRIRDEFVLPNGRTISIRGERISKQVQTCVVPDGPA